MGLDHKVMIQFSLSHRVPMTGVDLVAMRIWDKQDKSRKRPIYMKEAM